jgi:subtilisin family serine protease
MDDCSGHGTHIAGTVGGKQYGVAGKVRLHSVRVMDCLGKGTQSGAIAGVEWVTAHSLRPAVANMSISADRGLPSLDDAVTASILSGVTYVVAAHNQARDACQYSPARVALAITAGAVNPLSDMRHVTSNYGSCVDLFAPGTAILSAGIADDTATAFSVGTSMAAAHVAGVAALYLQLDPHATPAEVWEKIHSNDNVSTTPNWRGILNPGPFSPNELLHWGPRNDGYDDGDPHRTTAGGTYCHFR